MSLEIEDYYRHVRDAARADEAAAPREIKQSVWLIGEHAQAVVSYFEKERKKAVLARKEPEPADPAAEPAPEWVPYGIPTDERPWWKFWKR